MSSRKKKIVSVYIDGFNLYHAIDEHGEHQLKWINFMTLAKSFVSTDEDFGRVVFFTAVLTWNQAKQQRHRNFIAAQKACGVEVIESNFKRPRRYCEHAGRYCRRHEEKQTDVAIAVNILSDAMLGKVSKIVLVTADSDQVPLFKKLRELEAPVSIVLATPPGRETEARELGALAHTRQPLTWGRLGTCRLPRDVLDTKGRKVATMPALYLRGS